ncbi:hypothetical protein GCM10023149_20660 [Mucilaginibacter gynuensis]|uniref:Zeta toxin domain-containing protein n=1 Tax=Mucilaginibacter gynuensis TaxID=1302236 RepID=A0ABP8GB49_9SPHI
MLHFTVIAGPNGAGKSTFSAHFSRPGTLIFDPDKEKARIEKAYPDISEEAVQTAITRKYDGYELRAIGDKKHLTVETNLRNAFLGERAVWFREEAKYNTRLIFMMLPDIESSMDRVNLRVKQKGHFVDSDNIKQNFEMSRENLLSTAGMFNEVMLVCAASAYGIISRPELLLTIKNQRISEMAATIPDWAADVVSGVIKLATAVGDDTSYNRKRSR